MFAKIKRYFSSFLLFSENLFFQKKLLCKERLFSSSDHYQKIGTGLVSHLVCVCGLYKKIKQELYQRFPCTPMVKNTPIWPFFWDLQHAVSVLMICGRLGLVQNLLFTSFRGNFGNKQVYRYCMYGLSSDIKIYLIETNNILQGAVEWNIILLIDKFPYPIKMNIQYQFYYNTKGYQWNHNWNLFLRCFFATH